MSSDALTSSSRDLFEDAKLKCFFSIISGALALALLAFTCVVGGLSRSYDEKSQDAASQNDNDLQSANRAMAAGSGSIT